MTVMKDSKKDSLNMKHLLYSTVEKPGMEQQDPSASVRCLLYVFNQVLDCILSMLAW